MYTNKDLNTLENYLKKAKNWKHQNLIDKIKKAYFEYNKEINKYSSNYKKVMEESFDHIGISDLWGNFEFFNDKEFFLSEYLESQVVSKLKFYIQKIEAISTFAILKNKTNAVVFIGPNGSGKTTLLNKLKSFTGTSNVGYFSADRLNVYAGTTSSSRYLREFFTKFNDTNIKASNSNETNRTNYIVKQFGNAIELFQRVRAKEMDRFKNGEINLDNILTDKILNKWNSLIQSRILWSDGELKVKTHSEKEYSIDHLSSGEKSILYFLSTIILDSQKDYYFIDEPENSLHPLVVSELWDYLEEMFPESVFVYLTHDYNFALTRENSDVYWIKGYDGESSWDYKYLEKPKDIPQELLASLIGAKKPIILCESDKYRSLDWRIYNILFKEYTIRPVGSCDKVVELVKGYIHLNNPEPCYGIIDCDYKSNEYLTGLEKHNIFHSPFFEIECMLTCEEIVNEILLANKDKDKILEQYKSMLAGKLEKNKDIYIARRILCDLHNLSFSLNKGSKESTKNIRKEFLQYINNINIDKQIKALEDEFDNIMTHDKINDYLRIYDDKNILQDVAKLLGFKSKSDYIDTLIQLLEHNTKLTNNLRSNYFPSIKKSIY